MYFLVKKPTWLVFDPNEYCDEEVRMLQVRHKDGVSNTKLVKFEDGTWYLKNGSQMFALKSVGMKRRTGVGMQSGKMVEIKEVVDKKWFIKANDTGESL
ncbi:hypothetical protein CWI42_020280 [Ordospora colligata]|uniref:Uncharacterized protein n=1 Tax=Ordospora colligata OC4 TaxID=1354746 RepID=A0A0B2UMK5_9MICR|nr:uncharacterized protein M896_020290 [Ordospora colligata OC4]KHN70195.1 hypothetical protein M896_020290 [Ordospora colligata OC4]TBU16739.1 hypothetical protein CWI41_020300 [Ordospora colligata]TBU17045.1 hypothetical protein CWI40_020300 [Ordospora colligata]TBU19469.1 hypothetical protein CWI42_020280 [Ordospora colligata]